jgi:hypothetical protein
MSEVLTPPKIKVDKHGNEWVTFGPHHSLADVCRWIMQNRSEAEDVHAMLGQMLDGTYGRPVQ